MLKSRLGRTLAATDPFWRRYFEGAVVRLSRADILSPIRLQAEFSAEIATCPSTGVGFGIVTIEVVRRCAV